MGISIGLILWLIICISLNGLPGWYAAIATFIVGFIWGLVQEQIKYNKTRKENERDENER